MRFFPHQKIWGWRTKIHVSSRLGRLFTTPSLQIGPRRVQHVFPYYIGLSLLNTPSITETNVCACLCFISPLQRGLNSTQDAAPLSPPRVCLNYITAAMSYDALWFIERFWWGYERAKDKVISPLTHHGNTGFISLHCYRPLLSNPLFPALQLATSYSTRALVGYITPELGRGKME